MLSLVATIIIVGELSPKTWVAGLTGKISLGNFLYHLVPGLTLIGIGLGLIGLCHLPIRFRARVGLLAAVGAAGWSYCGRTASGFPTSPKCGSFSARCSCSD